MTRTPDPPGFLTLRVPIPDLGEYGPAMKALPNDRQRAFVIAFLETGGQNASEAARQAGYPDTPSVKITGHRLSHDAAIQEALLEESRRMLGANLPMATAFLVKVLTDDSPAVAMKDKLKAVDMILTRTGLPVQTEHKVTVEHRLSPEQMRERITELALRNGLDPKRLLGENVIDAEFTEVEEDWTAL